MKEIHDLNSMDDEMNRFSMIFIGLQVETQAQIQNCLLMDLKKLRHDLAVTNRRGQMDAVRFGRDESSRAT